MMDYPKAVTLAGEFYCELSDAERNQWACFCCVSEAYRQLSQAKARLEAAIHSGDGGLAASYSRLLIDATGEMHAVAADWYADLVAFRAPDDTPE